MNSYGDRMVTSGSDNKVNVWEKDHKGKWNYTQNLMELNVNGENESMMVDVGDGANSNAWRCSWAHKNLGNVIAFTDFEKKLHIWRQIEDCKEWLKEDSIEFDALI